MNPAAFAYAQARLQARLARRLSESDWQLLEASQDLAHCLDMAGRMRADNLTDRLGGIRDVHRIESILREDWCALVDEVSAWLPLKWRAASRWMQRLPFLLRAAAAGGDDPQPQWLIGAPGLSGGDAGLDARSRWLNGLQARVPKGGDSDGLQKALAPLFDRYLGPGPGQPVPTSQPLPGLSAGMIKLVRARTQRPVSVFAFLGLAALDYERLRGLLAARALFGSAGGRA